MAKHVTPREKRKARIRRKITGTAERPRLTVFRSAKHIYIQAVDDTTNTILASASDIDGSIAFVEFFDGAAKIGEDASAPFHKIGGGWNVSHIPYATYILRGTSQSGVCEQQPVDKRHKRCALPPGRLPLYSFQVTNSGASG